MPATRTTTFGNCEGAARAFGPSSRRFIVRASGWQTRVQRAGVSAIGTELIRVNYPRRIAGSHGAGLVVKTCVQDSLINNLVPSRG